MKHILTYRDVTLRFEGKTVLSHFDLALPEGGHTVLMGASGCGKTSLLKLAAGLIRPTLGEVILGDRPAGGKNPIRVAYQFQEPRLLPWLTAVENVNVVLSDSSGTLPQARAWLDMFGLCEAAGLYPAELSGGMAQRVALCRALAAPSQLLLLDEPFRGLDDETKEKVISSVLHTTRGKTLLLVTHDETEAAHFTGTPVRL